MPRRFCLLGSLAAALGVAVWLVPLLSADAKKEKEAGKSPTAAQLPIQQVVLFSSGVGYFQREGTIDGAQRIDLSFAAQDINDLIKSMTLRDLDGGRVNAVSYDSNVPVERTLQSFAVNLTGNPTFGQILNQSRGEKVEVVLQSAAAAQPGTLTGSLVGVEKKTIQVGKEAVESECLTLWCADGLRSVKLAEVARIRFLNALMESEFRKALETLALGHDTQKKTVSIHFDGKGKRQVKVGYVVENPIWKTSYRLVLPSEKKAEKEKKPYLQGWAVVENTTDEDWSGVKMALISGRPISFQMNLYDSLFITRPVVEPELFASLRPVAYSGAMDDNLKALGSTIRKQERLRAQTETGRNKSGSQDEVLKKLSDAKAKSDDDDMDLKLGVRSAATAEKLGDFFQYAIDHDVTLPRQKSALLPIVTADVESDRVSIYNESTHPKFPLLGLVFKNTTGMHLAQGPITVYDGGTYAGDARILDLQKDEQRLLSFAVDQGTEVHAVPDSDNGVMTTIKANKGVLHTVTKLKEKKTYTIANRNGEERTVVVEHPNRTNFALTSQEKPWETARDVHRFKVKVPAGKTVPFVVSEERTLNEQFQITNLDDERIAIFINAKATSPAVKKALEKAVELRHQLAQTQREIQQTERQLKTITDDQDRLRKNLKEMPPEAAAYKRYLQKFDDQETQIEAMQKKVKGLQDDEHAQKKSYESWLANLTVE